MQSYLIVANQTLGGAELESTVSERIGRDGGATFHVVVPMVEPEGEAAWSPGDAAFGLPSEGGADTARARRRSQHRLDAMVGRLRELGARADGEIGDHDALAAVRQVVADRTFDEVIVSTLPAGVSRWVKMDLASRIDRLVDCPVTSVEAEA